MLYLIILTELLLNINPIKLLSKLRKYDINVRDELFGIADGKEK